MSQRIVFQWPCCTANFQVNPKVSFLALCPCAGLLETILILHNLVLLQGAGNVGTHEILTRYTDFFL